MNDNIITAISTASSAVIIGVTALLLNYKLFNSLEKRIERIENDLKEFYKIFAEHDKRITIIEKGKSGD